LEQLLLQRVDNTSPLYKGLNVIANSAGAQKRLISDMLDLSSMLLGRCSWRWKCWTCATCRRSHRCAGTGGRRQGAGRAPAAARAAQPGAGRCPRLQQVFWNLLSNAIKFTPAEGRIDLQLRPTATTG
jgi:signal transduction histidine kinase